MDNYYDVWEPGDTRHITNESLVYVKDANNTTQCTQIKNCYIDNIVDISTELNTQLKYGSIKNNTLIKKYLNQIILYLIIKSVLKPDDPIVTINRITNEIIDIVLDTNNTYSKYDEDYLHEKILQDVECAVSTSLRLNY